MWAMSGLVVAAASLACGCTMARADTLEWALVQAYQNNPSLNAQRAALRATDENVPQALSGYRPKLSIQATAGPNWEKATQEFPGNLTPTTAEQFVQRTIGATATQTLYNGFQTANKTRQAESQVDAARETLRVTEQQVLLDAATAYMNLLRDGAILELNQSNVQVLTEQLKQTRDRFNVGEVTRTDVAQSESRLAAGRSALLGAQSNYVTSQANYRRVIGVDPGKLAPATSVDRLSPGTLPKAIAQGQALNPSVLAAAYGVDVAELAVKISEGALYPNLTLAGSALAGNYPQFETSKLVNASIVGTLTVPIYQGGAEYSAIRQFKETLGQTRLNLDTNRDQARATVVQSWASSKQPRRKSNRRLRKSTPPRSHSTACAKRRASASAPLLTCSTHSRNWSTHASPSLPHSTIASLHRTRCSPPSARCRCGTSAWPCRSMIRWCTTSRFATLGSACAIPTGGRLIRCRFGDSLANPHGLLFNFRDDILCRGHA